MIITVPFFAIALLLLGIQQSSPTGYQPDWSPSLSEVPSPPVMSGTGASLPPVSLRREYL